MFMSRVEIPSRLLTLHPIQKRKQLLGMHTKWWMTLAIGYPVRLKKFDLSIGGNAVTWWKIFRQIPLTIRNHKFQLNVKMVHMEYWMINSIFGWPRRTICSPKVAEAENVKTFLKHDWIPSVQTGGKQRKKVHDGEDRATKITTSSSTNHYRYYYHYGLSMGEI